MTPFRSCVARPSIGMAGSVTQGSLYCKDGPQALPNGEFFCVSAARLVNGADGGIRTHDLPLTRRLLCQLSYVGELFDAMREIFAEPARTQANIGRGCELSTWSDSW